MHRPLSCALAAALIILCSRSTLAQGCVGDCNGDHVVTIDEIVRGVGIALDLNPLTDCAALDANRDDTIDIAEIVAAVGNLASSCPAEDPRLVRTQSGLLRGNLASGVRSFLGIPYAAPPVADLRWRNPQPPAEWSGTRSANQAGSVCPQTVPIINAEMGDEDCLFLNVQTPNPPPAQPLPVMVWIHGGGFTSGDGLEFGGTDGSDIVRRSGVIVVTLNYRLGALGFLALQDFSADAGASEITGNYGLLDQVAALKWVRRNIGAFGGDPHNVTLFGESAGGFSVCFHLVSPLSAGLLHKAISESGVCTPTSANLADAREQGIRFARALNCDLGHSLDPAACLRAKRADEIRHTLPPDPNFAFTPGEWGTWSPIVDGTTVTGQVPDLIAAGQFNRVPVMLGSNRDEGTLFVALSHGQAGMPLTADQYSGDRGLGYFLPSPDLVAATQQEYPLSGYATPGAALAAAFGDAFLGCPAIDLASKLSPFVSTYLYQFNYPDASFSLPLDVPLGAFHSADIQFVFGRRAGGVLSAGERQLSDLMMGYWTRFARTGDPNAATAPTWPLHGDAANYLAIDRETVAAQAPKAGQCAFWRGVDYFRTELADPWAEARRVLAENRAKWAASHISAYTMLFHRGCFCPGPADVEIAADGHGGLQIRDAQSGELLNLSDPASAGYLSVEQTFSLIEQAIDAPVPILDVAYAPLLGYPTRIFIDHQYQAVDDETEIEIRALLPFPAQTPVSTVN